MFSNREKRLILSVIIGIFFNSNCKKQAKQNNIIYDDVYLIKLQREVLQILISTRRMQISQICGISEENTHENNIDLTEQPSDKMWYLPSALFSKNSNFHTFYNTTPECHSTFLKKSVNIF
jgi:hypothetical protein